jgi:DNA (cytosine-5)-methyltransferase 1
LAHGRKHSTGRRAFDRPADITRVRATDLSGTSTIDIVAKPTAIDLFAGAGGATQGLRDAGFRVLSAVEIDDVAAATYRANHPRVRLITKDITEVDPDELRVELGLKRGELTLLKACPPCQGYSSIGKGDEDDPRNDLVREVWRFARAFRPRVVLLENVPGLGRDERLTGLVRQLRAVGYTAKTYVVDATTFGVPQRRRRLIVVAVLDARRAIPDSLADLLPGWIESRGSRTAGEALARAARADPAKDRLHRPRAPSEVVVRRLAALPIAGTRFDLPAEHQLGCHSRLDKRNATASYSRVLSGAPAPTMTTRCTTPACGQFVHPTEARALTLREAATIQTFPLTYRFVGGPGQVERQIGNAVPVRMARGLALCSLALIAV